MGIGPVNWLSARRVGMVSQMSRVEAPRYAGMRAPDRSTSWSIGSWPMADGSGAERRFRDRSLRKAITQKRATTAATHRALSEEKPPSCEVHSRMRP
jgi:hypothetical protein